MGFSAYAIAGGDEDPLSKALNGLLDHGAEVDQRFDSLLLRIAELEARLAAGEAAARGEDEVVAHAFGARPKNVANA